MSTIYNFENGLAVLKESAIHSPLNESALRDTKVYAKLILNKGIKMTTKSTKAKDLFQFTKDKVDPKTGAITPSIYAKAELFILNRNNSMVIDQRVFVSIDLAKSAVFRNDQMFFVELVHPTIDLTTAKPVKLS